MHGSQPPITGALAEGAGHDGDAAHGSVRSYVIGFGLSVVLTAIPFALVMSGAFAAGTAVSAAIALGVVQIVVHLVYFLHMNSASGRSWNMAALVFTMIVLAILIAGSLWVMHNLDVNMMPGMMPSE
jgi:cytochrome o ubiquinol oxidase operon protein cyoD